MLRKIILIALLLWSVLQAHSQAYTTITATNVTVDNGSGTAVNPPSGSSLCFLGVNNAGTAITYTPSGGSPVSGTVCQTLNGSGGLTGSLQVANPATASPLGLLYTITVVNGSTTYLTLPVVATVTGSVWSYDAYALPGTGTALGIGYAHIGCAGGAQWTSTTLPPGLNSQLCSNQGLWRSYPPAPYCPTGQAYVVPQTGGQPFCIAPTLTGNGAPSGSCTQNAWYLDQTSASVYACQASAWVLKGGGGSGTVNSGTTGQMAYYSASGTTVSAASTIFLAPSGDTTGVTDNAAIQTAITASKSIFLGIGQWYITGLTASAPFRLDCYSPGTTMLNMASATGTYFNVSYGGGKLNSESPGAGIYNCGFQPKSGVTPTGGYVLSISGASGSLYLSGFHFEGNQAWGFWGGINLGSYIINNFFRDNMFVNGVVNSGAGCIYMNTPVPGGDAVMTGTQCIQGQTNTDIGIIINQGDTNLIGGPGTKVNGYSTGVKFLQNGPTYRPRFDDVSVENATYCYDFGTGSNPPTQVQIIGAGCTVSTNLFNNLGSAVQLMYLMNDATSADGSPGGVANGWTWQTLAGTVLNLNGTTNAAANLTNSDSSGGGSTQLNLSDDGVTGQVSAIGPNNSLDATLKSTLLLTSGTNGKGVVIAGCNTALTGCTGRPIRFRPKGLASTQDVLFLDGVQNENLAIVNYLSQSAIASASTIAPVSQMFHVTGTTAIVTITAPSACTTSGQMCQLTLIPDGLWTTATGGNIAIASTAVVSKALIMTYDPGTLLWYPSY